MRGGLAQGLGGRVFGGVPPFARDVGGWKFYDDDAALGPAAFEDFHLATADKEAATVFFNRGEDGFAVVLVADWVVDFDADENISGHFWGPF